MTTINDEAAAKAAWISDLTQQIQRRLADQPEPDAGVPQMPEGLPAIEKMRWAREHQPPVVELQQAQPVQYPEWDSLPQAVKEMRPVDRMAWVRRRAQ